MEVAALNHALAHVHGWAPMFQPIGEFFSFLT